MIEAVFRLRYSDVGMARKRLSEIEHADRWLKQFKGPDRQIAELLADEIRLVTRDEFFGALQGKLTEVASEAAAENGTAAFYPETPIKQVFGRIPSYFPGTRHGRATGPGLPPIKYGARDKTVGSEGVVSQLITDFVRQNHLVALAHPGPDDLRDKKVRRIVLVTDFIGSGSRIYDMLESFRYVASVRSWKSTGLLEFVVVAFSGTNSGIDSVKRNRLKPEVRIVEGCPTIRKAFPPKQRLAVEDICRRYPPNYQKSWRMGWNGGGALIAFAHSCPNNSPPMLWSVGNGWKPLFPKRSTTPATAAFPQNKDDFMDQRADRVLGIQKARKTLDDKDSRKWASAMLVLKAASSGQRLLLDISASAGIGVSEVATILEATKVAKWISTTGAITPLGRRELARLARRERRKPKLPNDGFPFYYPSQLRVP